MRPALARSPKITCDAGVNAPGKPHERQAKPQSLRWSWLWLTGTAATMAVGWAATVRPEGATWFGIRGPECPLAACLGPIACPGCGLVRSTSSALQGDLAQAFAMHPGGIGIALLLPATFAVHFDILRRGREYLGHRRLRRVGFALTSSVIVLGWLIRFSF